MVSGTTKRQMTTNVHIRKTKLEEPSIWFLFIMYLACEYILDTNLNPGYITRGLAKFYTFVCLFVREWGRS